jgi:hypothetical protein
LYAGRRSAAAAPDANASAITAESIGVLAFISPPYCKKAWWIRD